MLSIPMTTISTIIQKLKNLETHRESHSMVEKKNWANEINERSEGLLG